MTIQVGVIGAGIMGGDHVRNLAGAVSGASVSLVADRRTCRCAEYHRPAQLTVVGAEAALTIDGPFTSPGGLTVTTANGARHRWDGTSGSHVDGLHFQAAAVARAISSGRAEVAERPLGASILALRVADELRRQAGIVFPGE